MADFRPDISNTTPLILLIPTYTEQLGAERKIYPDIQNGILFYGSFKTYGGTERTVNDLYVVEDTAIITTWYRPDIQANCRISRANDGAIYEIINEPENIEMRNQFLKFKVRRIKGGA